MAAQASGFIRRAANQLYGMGKGLISHAIKEITDGPVEKAKGFRAIVDGSLCSVDDATLISPVKVKWVYSSRSFKSAATGATATERGKARVVDEYRRFISAGPGFTINGAHQDVNGDIYVIGLLYKGAAGPFVLLFVGGKRAVSFRNDAEYMYWCEQHLSVEEYLRVFHSTL